jgi:uncharacterized membrane protein (UPF0182 family)
MISILIFLGLLIIFVVPIIIFGYRIIKGEGFSLIGLSARIIWLIVGLTSWASIEFGLRIWTDVLWFRELGFEERFWIVFSAKWKYFLTALMIAVSFMISNLFIIRRGVPEKRAFTIANILMVIGSALAGLLAIVFGLYAVFNWDKFLLMQNQQTFGVIDPVFGKDIGFYLFGLPGLEEIMGMTKSLLFFTIFMVAGYYTILHRRYEAIQERYSWNNRYNNDEQENPKTDTLVSGNITKAITHLSILFVLWTLASIFGTYIDRWDLLFTTNGAVHGVGYVDEHFRIPAYGFYMVALIIAAIVFGASAIARSIKISSVLAGAGVFLIIASNIIGIVALPQLYQYFKLRSNTIEMEAPYLERNIEFTRMAYGLSKDKIVEKEFKVNNKLDPTTIQKSQETIDGIRIWDWRVLQATNSQMQLFRPYYSFADVDVVRYIINGKLSQLMYSGRELDQEKLPDQAKRWQNMRMVYTHGFGGCANPVNAFTEEGLPDYTLKDIPPVSKVSELEIKQPRIYFGEQTNTHVYVKTKLPEFDYPGVDHNKTFSYDGPAGIELNSFLRKFAFALRFDGFPLLLCDQLTDKSRILFDRDIATRVQKIAPFLIFDGDMYQVIADKQIWFIWDAYTFSRHFPYSESFFYGNSNYIRNSVKVVVNAYTGKVDFYIFDEKDPIIKAYKQIFPGMFKKASEMPISLKNHIRYPEDLLTIQGNVIAKYHMTDATMFYNREDMWEVAKEVIDINQEEPDQILPYYINTKLPEETKSEFIIMLPFTPLNTDKENPRNNMTGWLAGRCDGEHYGELLLYKFPKDTFVNGPRQIGIRINQDDEISGKLSLWNQQGSSVTFGNLLVIPLANFNLLYVQPIYMQAKTGKMPELQRVAVSDGERFCFGKTFSEALNKLVGTEVMQASAQSEKQGSVPSVSTEQKMTVNDAAKHLKLYQDFTAKGKFTEAGREMERLSVILNSLIKK